jgi:phenylpropionate dioxygenase-like ring-hydroxylating dioxygenase large terminal subunit
MGQRGIPFESFPTGWFQAQWSDALKPGGVVPLRYFDEDLVCYRSEHGQVHILDGHCPHMGAHLGLGGFVTEDDIVCPYHQWRWTSEGRNCSVPYSTHLCKRRLRAWPVREQGGLILLWHDAAGRPPQWEPPDIAEAADERYYPCYPDGAVEREVRFQPQMAVENVVDLAHVKYVHGWVDLPEVRDAAYDGPTYRNTLIGEVPTKRGPLEAEIENEVWGLGMTLSRLYGVTPTTQLAAITPIDRERSVFRLSIWVQGRTADQDNELSPVAKSIIDAQAREVLGPTGDLRIFENQVYRDRAPFVPEEAKAFNELRRWCRQFYPETLELSEPLEVPEPLEVDAR